MPSRHLTRRHVLTSGLATAACIGLPAPGRAAPRVTSIGGPAYGTRWRATLHPGADAEGLRAVLEDTLSRIDRLMSPWRNDSAISVFNRQGSVDWQPIAPDIATVARTALTVRHASGGAFDPSVGPLAARWGFGPFAGGVPPADTGFAVSQDALRKGHPALTLDLCGIAKGYALDRMVQALIERGQRDFVIDLGGEIAARGHHPEGRRWQVAVEDPRPDRSGAVEVIALDRRAIATSGDKVNGYQLGARRYSHIIDPGAAAPVTGATASVSVIAADAMTADAWATALMAAGAGGPKLAERNRLDALFLLRDGADLRRVPVGRFDDHLA